MRRLITTLFGIIIFISACTSQTNQIATLPSSTPKPLITVEDTQKHIRPTRTPTFVEPTITPTPKLDRIAIPKWVSDPDADVLLLSMTTSSLQFKNFALVNSNSGEVYNLPELDRGDYFWMSDGKHFGTLSEDEKEILLVDIMSGEISYHHPSKKAVRFVNAGADPPYLYKAIGEKVEDPEFLLIYNSWDISADGHYLVLENPYYDPGYTRVLDLRTDETITLTEVNDSIFDIAREWSPTGAYLGIVHSDEEPGAWFRFDKDPNFRVKIYDIEHSNVIGIYKNISTVNWSTDGTKFLYQQWTKSPNNEFQYRQNPPCVFDMITGITNCYNEVIVRHTTSTTYDLSFSSMQWSPDGKIIGYIYSRIERKSQEPYQEEHGGICLITVVDNSIKCVLEKIESDKQIKYPIEFWWSPNGDYLAFIANYFGPFSDDVGGTEIGIVNIHSGEYFIIGRQVHIHDAEIWRPKINP